MKFACEHTIPVSCPSPVSCLMPAAFHAREAHRDYGMEETTYYGEYRCQHCGYVRPGTLVARDNNTDAEA